MRPLALLVVPALIFAACGAPSDGAGPSPTTATLVPGTVVGATPQSYRDTLRSLRGRPLVVNFWASWCVPCLAEMPRLVDAMRRYGDEVGFLGVDVEDVTEDAEEFLDRMSAKFPSLGDPRGEIRRAERIVGLPTTHFYHGDGRLAFSHAGEISAEQLESKLKELVRIDRTGQQPPGEDVDEPR